jgi:exonuclease III
VQPALRFNLDEEGQGTPPGQHDKEGRVILASFGTFDFLGTYVPNQGASEESFARRRGWDAKVRRLLVSRAAGAPRPLVWGGDLNVAAAWEDVGPDPDWFRSKNGQGARCAEERGQPGFTPAEQERFADLMQAGELLDAHRLLHPTPSWTRDATWRGTPGAPPNPPEYGRYYGKGMRIDYVLVQRQLRARLVRTAVLGHGFERRGFLGSDHCPLLLELAPCDPPAAAAAAPGGGGGGPSSLDHAAVAGGAADASASCGPTDGGTSEPELDPEPEQGGAGEPAPAPPTPALTTDHSPEGHSAARRPAPRACSACTLETEDAAQAKCEACGCELEPPSSATRCMKPDTAAAAVAPASPHKKSIESFFAKQPG